VTLLANGRILVVGGLDGDGCLASAEYYDPVVGAWRSAGSMSVGRCFHSAVLTASGSVLVAGGLSSLQGPALASAELYDPATNTWARTAGMTEAREAPAAALLPSGDVLLAGGMNPGAGVSRGSELFHPVGRPPR
jgi:N-acetylneuraminic acid mutarotase